MSTTCLEFRHPMMAQEEAPYWLTRMGINRRIKALAQDYSYKIVNRAVKIVAPTNGTKWIRWLDMGDDRVCDICRGYATGGRSGFYHVTWSMPNNPHPGCRCEREIWFEDPFA